LNSILNWSGDPFIANIPHNHFFFISFLPFSFLDFSVRR